MSVALEANQGKKLNSHKLLMYIAMGSITMMFAGWLSAYMVREAQGRWTQINLPQIFYYSTAVLLLSSITIWLAIRAFKNGKLALYRISFTCTILLGITFLIMQYLGFKHMYYNMDIKFNENNAAGEFTYTIPLLHGLHVAGGVIAFLVVLLTNTIRRLKNQNKSLGLELVGIYWHFVDALWLYIFIFLLVN